MSETSQAAPAAPAEASSSPDSSQSLENTSQNSSSSESTETDIIGEALGLDEVSSEAEIQAAQKAGEISKKEAQSLKKKLQIKVDGKTEDIELDFNDEEGLKRHLQKAKAFDKRAKEYATLQNQIDMFFKEFENNPEAVMRKLGKDPEKFAEELLTKKIKEMEKSPEQLEKEKMTQELEDLRQEKKKITEAKDRAEMEKLRNQYAIEIENEISEGLNNSNSLLPKNNPRIIGRVTTAMLQIMEMKDDKGNALYPDVKIKDVLPIVEKEWREEFSSFVDGSPEDKLEDLIGKHNFERLRKKRLASRPKTATTSSKEIRDTGSKSSEENTSKTKEKVSMKKFFRDL